MKESPILFNGDMVRAILAGQKTQTRRTVVPPTRTRGNHGSICPYGQPGDRLWVRERWAADMSFDDLPPRMLAPRGMPIYYHATAQCMDYKWRQSIHMPRWASRITLEITDVREERVQNITSDGAIAEGAYEVRKVGDDIAHATWTMDGLDWRYDTPREAFAATWDSLYAARGLSWDVNPWVWVVTFKRAGKRMSLQGKPATTFL